MRGHTKNNFISTGGIINVKSKKKGVQVKIVAGKDKGKTGEILEIHRKLNRG